MTKEEQLARLWEILNEEQYWIVRICGGGWWYKTERTVHFDYKAQQINISSIFIEHCFKSEQEALSYLMTGNIDRGTWDPFRFDEILHRCKELNLQVPISFYEHQKENQNSALKKEVNLIDEEISRLELTKRNLLNRINTP